MKVETTQCVVCGDSSHRRIAAGTDYDYHTASEPMTFVACRTCRHLYLNPRPAPEAASIIYPSGYYTFEGSHHRGVFRLMGWLKDLITIRRLRGILQAVPEGGRVVDLGCGDGSLLLAIRSVRPLAELVAVDLGFTASRRSVLEGAGIRCIESPLESAELPAEVDLVIMNQVIEHLWQLDACLAKVSASLRHGGRLSVCTPNVDGYDARWFRGGAWGGYYFPRHLNLFNRESLATVLGRHSLTVSDWRNLVAPLIWASTMRALQERRRWPRWMRPKDTNLLFLAAFSLLDRLVMLFGGTTSNQQAVASRD